MFCLLMHDLSSSLSSGLWMNDLQLLCSFENLGNPGHHAPTDRVLREPLT